MNKVKDKYHIHKKQTYTNISKQMDKLSRIFACEIITDKFID